MTFRGQRAPANSPQTGRWIAGVRSIATWAALLALGVTPAMEAANRAAAAARTSRASEPDRVVVSSVEAFDAGGQVLVRWETAFEVGVIGFDLYRGTGPQAVKVNRTLVRAEDDLIGGRYEVLDPDAPAPGTYSYRIEAALVTGRSVAVTTRQVAATAKVAPEEVLAPQRSQPKVPRPRTPKEAPAPAPGPEVTPLSLPPGGIDLPNSDVAVKITLITNITGMHFLSAKSVGTLLGKTEADVAGWMNGGTVALYNRGEKVTYHPGTGYVEAPNVTGPGLFFYATLNQNNYTYRNVYFLRKGQNLPLTSDGQNPAPVYSGAYWTVHEQEVDFSLATSIVFEPEADFWMWGNMSPGDPALPYSCPLDAVARGPGTNAVLTVRLRGASSQAHRVEATVNGQVVGDGSWSGLTAYTNRITFPSEYLLDTALGEGNTPVTFRAVPVAGVVNDLIYIDGFRIDFTRKYAATRIVNPPTGRFEGGADTNTTMTVTNFWTTSSVSPPPAPNIMVFDVTNPRQLAVVNNVAVGLQGSSGTSRRWYASFTPATPANRYAVVQYPSLRSSVAVPETLSLAYPANLKADTNQGSYVTIAPPALTNSARILADYRSSTFRTKWVNLDDIYNEFSDGLVTPHAISNFLAWAYTQWPIPPRYTALIGDGTIRYREFFEPNDNLVPPLMIATDFGLFASDKFGAVDGEATPRIAVGRFPVLNATEFNNMLAKIQAYEGKSVTLPLKALLVADQPDGAGDFIENIEDVRDILQPRYSSVMVHPDLAPTPIDYTAMRSGVQANLDGGVDVMSYVGHGAQDRIGSTGPNPTDKGYQNVANTGVTTTTIELALSNGARLPIVTAMTCVVGNFSLDNYQSFAEVLVTQPGSGAAAMVGPTGPSYDSDAIWLNRRFMQELACSGSVRLGDLLLQAFSLYNAQGTKATPVWMYVLLGDPALLISSPTTP